MQVVQGHPPSSAPVVHEMSRFKQLRNRIKHWLIRQRRRLPYLVWWNDELDVSVTFSQDRLNPDGGIEQLWSGAFADIERSMGHLGIHFDKGMGAAGRDWEWDWSLEGPISVRFRGRACHPETRMERPRPRLVKGDH